MLPAETFQEIRPDLYFWQAYDPAVKVDLSCCARVTNRGLVFIDPTSLAEAALERLAAAAAPVAIVLTNGNHARAADEFRRRFAVPIFAHADAIPELGIAVDETLEDGGTVLDTFTVIALPGAAAGEIALHAADVLHAGDALIHLPKTGFALLPEKYCADAAELPRSLGKLLRFPFQVLTFAHGLPLVSDARPRLAQLLA